MLSLNLKSASGALFFVLTSFLISCSEDNAKPEVKPQPESPASVKPTVTTDSVITLTDSSARIGGRVDSTGSEPLLTAGMEWKLASASDSAYSRLEAPRDSLIFQFLIEGLSPKTNYSVRAFASSAAGTSFGKVVSFTTDSLPDLSCPATVTDIEGNVYKTIKIGTQCWMKENLRTSKYRNGDGIKIALDDATWSESSIGLVCQYNDDISADSIYGKLYNLYAVMDSKKLCPSGWHVPTDSEWLILENYLGGSAQAGGKMKATGILPSTGLWASPNSGASNISGFTGFPGGYRMANGPYDKLSERAYWWSSRVGGGSRPRYLSSSDGKSSNMILDGRAGLSVRCIAD